MLGIFVDLAAKAGTQPITRLEIVPPTFSSSSSPPQSQPSPVPSVSSQLSPDRVVGRLALCVFHWQTEKVITLTEPQTWTSIGVLAAALVGALTLVMTMLIRTMTTQFASVHNEIGGLRNELVSEIRGMRGEMNARFETVNTRLNTLERDVQGPH